MRHQQSRVVVHDDFMNVKSVLEEIADAVSRAGAEWVCEIQMNWTGEQLKERM